MAQILPPRTNVGTDIGRALGMGLQSGIDQSMQQQYQQGRLQDSFNKLQPGTNFIDQLKTIAPALLSTPGGAQALGELSPLLSNIAQQNAVATAIKNRRESNQIGGQQSSIPNQNITAGGRSQPGIDFRNPQPPQSPETPFPERTVGPTTQPEMTPRQIEDYALDLMEQSALAGKPVDINTARQTALAANNDIRAYNQGIQKEKSLIKEAQEAQTQHMVERAKNSGLIKDPEDQTIISKFALEAKNAPNNEAAWEYVRSKARQFETAKQGLLRNYQLPNPISSAYRKITGTYKDKETAGKEAQPYLDFYRKNGLYDEARNVLTSDIGLGSEDAETWLFPFNKKEVNEINNFRTNTNQPSLVDYRTAPGGLSHEFPGEGYQLNNDKFQGFKDNLSKILNENPGINVISLRGKLNQDKKYAWQDISRAVNELIAEKRFSPDPIQDQQITVINSAPLPGLAKQFEFLLKGTK